MLQKIGIDVTICGEMAGDPVNIPILMGLGLKELSMNSGSIPIVKQIIRKLDFRETKKIANKILEINTVSEISDLLQKKYKSLF